MKWAAQRWAAGNLFASSSEPAAIEEARRSGFTEEGIEQLRVALGCGPNTSAIWRQNVPIVEAFLAVCTQWRVAPVGGGMMPLSFVYLGLDYAAARAGIDFAGITVTSDVWAGVRFMESVACGALNGARR